MTQPKVHPMKGEKRKRYSSVAGMVRDLAEEPVFADAVEKRIEERNIIDNLMALRTRQGLSQKDIAARMKCTQSRISKLENGKDDDLRIGDFRAYADALGLEMNIVLASKRRRIVDDIKHHALSIKRLLGELSRLAEKDAKIADGVKDFVLGEAAYNIIKILLEAINKAAKGSARKLRLRRNDAGPSIQIELQEDEIEGELECPKDCEVTVLD